MSSGDLDYYRTTKEDADVRTAKIVNELDTAHCDQEPQIMSYDDAKSRSAHGTCVDTVCNSFWGYSKKHVRCMHSAFRTLLETRPHSQH